ncbi:3-deoxy-7-phosphoheptulonate synthase [Alkaliphilus peptidifermentans]|uniref:3-deoxy-D-arabinoheptulosonate-7-phosphate synthase n=1 Tax=Alkaliphilus peptidifermentans DSM 18978 TaxID=1120976 RepID=A0A1G5B9V5_9FIRM|nr:3-deoxy-7-phosphoheptulonate synthase [Alkaliphilus peptidifermentans]SCX86899.1 3-deoxy-D-arabinoheptulosonate-7-phosphate synthase [Alkaliphilus peptidifermentans DSM 18978]
MELKIINKKHKEDKKKIKIKNVEVGGDALVVFAGPCAVENRQQIMETAEAVKTFGGQILRGGAFKPRTSPYSFQGLGEEGLKLLKEAGEKYDMPIVSEVMDTREVEMVCQYVDIIQIGSRNMQNFSLLREIGKIKKPIMLKRGMAASIEEWLMAAEYIASEGNEEIILCERGIRTFETYTRNTLDLSVVPLVRQLSSLPIIVDPSHGTGIKELIAPMSLASIAAGAHGIMVEIHPKPQHALSDGKQSLHFEEFNHLMKSVRRLHEYLKKQLVMNNE